MIYYLLVWSFVLDGELHEGRKHFRTLYECEVAREEMFNEPEYKRVHPGLIYCDAVFAVPNYKAETAIV